MKVKELKGLIYLPILVALVLLFFMLTYYHEFIDWVKLRKNKKTSDVKRK